MYVKRRWTLAQYIDKIRYQPFGKKFSYLYRMGWKNIPEVMIGIPIVVVSVAGLIYIAEKLGPHPPRKYHESLYIYRPGDPRIGVIPERSPIDP